MCKSHEQKMMIANNKAKFNGILYAFVVKYNGVESFDNLETERGIHE